MCADRDPEARVGESRQLRPVEKPARVRRLGTVPTEPLRRQVARLSESAWRREDRAKENDYACFHHTRHIIFRFIEGNRDPRRFYSNPGWAVWYPLPLPVMVQAAAPYGYARPIYPKAMLAGLVAGHWIDRHVGRPRDGTGSHPYVHKTHVPLETGPAAVLHVGGTDFHLQAGHAYEINNLLVHGAFNGSETNRIHLVFEVFERAGAEWAGRPFRG